jgi:hypothetical protein
MAQEMEVAVAALGEERDLAGDHPLVAVADKEAELVPLDMLDQEFGAGFAEGGRQIDHGVTL